MTQIKKPKVTHNFYWLTQDEESLVCNLINKNIEVKADSYLKSVYSKGEDAEVRIEYKVHKNKKNRFEASFRFFYDWKTFVYRNKTSFKYVNDLVNHSFTHFTRKLAEHK